MSTAEITRRFKPENMISQLKEIMADLEQQKTAEANAAVGAFAVSANDTDQESGIRSLEERARAAQRADRLVKVGELGRAATILQQGGNTSIVGEASEEDLAQLQALHPEPIDQNADMFDQHPISQEPVPGQDDKATDAEGKLSDLALAQSVVTEETVQAAHKSMHRLTAAGTSAWTMELVQPILNSRFSGLFVFFIQHVAAG